MNKGRQPSAVRRQNRQAQDSQAQNSHVQGDKAQTFRAGCGRTWQQTFWQQASTEPLAYTAQAFSECPACLHRVEPEGGPPFCTLRPLETAHPFAALASFRVGE